MQWRALGGKSVPMNWRKCSRPIYAPHVPAFDMLTTFGELDDKTLQFPSESALRPFRRCLHHQALLARTKALTHGWVSDDYEFDDFSCNLSNSRATLNTKPHCRPVARERSQRCLKLVFIPKQASCLKTRTSRTREHHHPRALVVTYPGINAPPWAVDLRQWFDRRFNEAERRFDQRLGVTEHALQLMEQRLGQQVDATNQLGQRLDATNRRLEQRLDATNQQFGQQLDAMNQQLDATNQLGQRLDAANQQLRQQLDATSQRLAQRLDATNRQLQATEHAFAQQMDVMGQQLLRRKRQFDQRADQFEENHRAMDASLHNTRAAMYDAFVVDDHDRRGQVHRFRRFVKETPGLGARLPGVRGSRAHVPRLGVGQWFPIAFSQDYPDLQTWSHRQISDLGVLLNEDFGISRDDSLHEWREKLRCVLLFGGADGKVFFEDVFLLESAGYAASETGWSTRAASRRGDAQLTDALQWKRLVVSRGTSPCSPMFSSGGSTASPRAIRSGVERRAPTFARPGAGRDYHTMHYVQSSDESARGMRVLVIGNVVVASDEVVKGGGGTQSEGGGVNAALAFDAPTLRVEELRVRQPLLEALWEVRRMDHSSIWKPRARHAHSSAVVGGDQVFMFGGKDATSSTFFNDIFYYDAPLNQWVKPRVDPTGQLPQPRAFAGLTASDDGNTLFLFGGTDGKQEFGSLFLYDVINSRWDSLAGATLGDRPSCRINHSLTFAVPNHLILFGGRRRAMRQNELFIYNVETRTWRLVGGLVDGQRSSRRRSSQPISEDKAPIGRTAHATVLFQAETAGPNAVQKLLIFGGYAGSHQWLDDLYLLSLPQAVLMQSPPPTRSASRLIAATRKGGPAARVALSAPQLPIQTSEANPRLEPSTQSVSLQPSTLTQEAPQSSQATSTTQEQLPSQPVDSENQPAQVNPEQPRSLPPSSRVPEAATSSPAREFPPKEPSRSGTIQRCTAASTTTTGSGALTDITNTNQLAVSSQKQSAMPRTSGSITTGADAPSPGTVKKHKRRRLAEDSQDSNNSNSNSSNGSAELTTAQVGIQTTLLQLLQHQPRVEDTLARILSMLTREQTARQQQTMNQDTLMRVHSEEQSKRLEAAARRNEALEGRLARSEAERASLHEKLMARETELYMHKHSLEAAIPPLSERVQAIEASHMEQLNVSRAIESKISAVHDFMDELRNAGGEGTELDDSPQHLRRLDESVATQPTPSPPKPLLYPHRVVQALEDKVRVMRSEKEALETKVSLLCSVWMLRLPAHLCFVILLQLKEMADKLKRVEEREAQARQFLFSWCQDGNLPLAPAAPTPGSTSASSRPESTNTDTDNMTRSVDS
ncbi:unnamed protein product [Phytophthora lilii]|uniref:Unnamed protein product n=1 Tax=Phytophthora lilii TaxID=2077276 RepID=A0A9W6U7X6_9STRA|nr:unnamed protein product [Phytophthora lilii]